MSFAVRPPDARAEWSAVEWFCYRRRVSVPVIADSWLVALLLTAIITAGRGPAWVWLILGLPPLVAIMVVFLGFAAVCWSWPYKQPGGPPLDPKTLLVLILSAVGLILDFTILYWTVGSLSAGSALYAAVGTLTAVHPLAPADTTGNVLLVAQGLADLVFISGVVPVVLSRAVDRPSAGG